MEKYVVLVNGGLWGGGKVFVGLESVKKMFKDEGVKKWFVDDGDEDLKLSFNEGIEMMLDFGGNGDKVVVKNKELLEMGDDFVEFSICKLLEEE